VIGHRSFLFYNKCVWENYKKSYPIRTPELLVHWLSQNRTGLAAATVGSLALFDGGRTNSSDSSAMAVVDNYNAANDS
jgi:hypothetical protein